MLAAVGVNSVDRLDALRGEFRDLEHQWFWDGQDHVDPAKEAAAQAMRLSSYGLSLCQDLPLRMNACHRAKPCVACKQKPA